MADGEKPREERSVELDETVELVNRAKLGDDEAWDRLHERFSDVMQRRARAGIGPELRANQEESADILQSTWREAVGDLPHYEHRGEGSLLAWLTRIMRNKILSKVSHMRAGKRDRGRAGQDGDEPDVILQAVPARERGPESNVTLKEEKLLLRRALLQLDEDARHILLLSRFDGCTHVEIGKRMGITEDAARMRVKRAEAQLVENFRKLDRGSS